jgi:hypothetical protein
MILTMTHIPRLNSTVDNRSIGTVKSIRKHKVFGEYQMSYSSMPKKKKAAAKASPKKDSYQSSMKKPSMKVVGPTAERPYKHYKG